MANSVFPSMSAPGGFRSQDRLVLDNLIRRELKIGDPGDPAQVAQALLERYRDDPRAQAISQESRGLPFLQTTPAAPVVQMLTAAGGAEWQQALADIEQDLQSLTRDSILKDVTPEIRGWAQAIRSALQEGYNAARFALDPHNRDKGFAMRRQLNDYARLARLVGAHTPAMLTNFRKFAQSLDEAANLLIVIMGEALANVGFGGGRYVPQVPYAELQTRRDAAIHALRKLVGTTQVAYGPEDWPRGLDAYRQISKLLDAQGQSDLRSLLVETELARSMDELVQRSGDNTADGLRAVGSTAQLGLDRFRRFITVTRRGVSPESPALYAFLEALSLFMSAFDSAGGFRLMKIARPPILFYGLYGSSGLDPADQRLVDIVSRRNLIADEIDCLAGACCTSDRGCLVLLDKVLYDIDRAIDLYALGFTEFGTTELRASAYGYVIEQVSCVCLADLDANNAWRPKPDMKRMHKLLAEVQTRLHHEVNAPTLMGAMNSVLRLVSRASNLAGNDQGLDDAINVATQRGFDPAQVSIQKKVSIRHITDLYAALAKYLNQHPVVAKTFQGDPQLDDLVGLVEQELCMQLEMERNWGSLVHSLVANCSQIDGSLARVQTVLSEAILVVAGKTCPAMTPLDLPPTIETSLDTFLERIDRIGTNRPNPALFGQQR